MVNQNCLICLVWLVAASIPGLVRGAKIMVLPKPPTWLWAVRLSLTLQAGRCGRSRTRNFVLRINHCKRGLSTISYPLINHQPAKELVSQKPPIAGRWLMIVKQAVRRTLHDFLLTLGLHPAGLVGCSPTFQSLWPTSIASRSGNATIRQRVYRNTTNYEDWGP